MKRSQNNTKGKIVSAAWKLFYEQGYDKTTVDDIVEASGTSKGSFYHYFESKESLPASLSYLFDEKYEELTETMDPSLGVIEKLVFINQELFLMIENTVSIDILSRLFASQLVSGSERSLLDPTRTYYKLLRQIVIEGQQQGLFREEFTTLDVTRAYAVFERGLMYDWCISGGNYSLAQYSAQLLPQFLMGFCKESVDSK
ncbi:MAG: TetR/AcrR family transcriptional regulator [Firmicutes bacterium]|nr:TetR/AcrR family transcriptional regulator [Bacillota bacterium]MBQ1476440.1 TetR/AcrR family transcriptional regulator [Bacillota bacterium]MBQ2083714.1 TetR/AcrR family transcriptional regulator [Bacillota bacterium]MBQ2218497.1 TetR/AcrR family transcriptional regulator [Bacillota bacterium]MBR3395802.1 TetR/AcrR family transcriptional regulator [Bacillota bacterium]